ncbi:MAG TPA: bacillithiol biosynthesis cysteine-adding enzyme BshC [Candidatus Eremiobacteraeota bacterium]|nr:MAG: hypothetical protein BWY64_01146 [bacterium ADurb.Bin363]HPZ06735.1 bacillithiol biosynthesis cysteine-adding enzyme BshC [Candidatus Eremiobacteraeota bacterium]
MIINLSYNTLPGQNKYFLNYISGRPEALNFFSYIPGDFEKILRVKNNIYQRDKLSKIILDYNQFLQAPKEAKENAELLSRENVFTVITGQQAGFIGGPVYTAYKIATVINITKKLSKEFQDYFFVPVFWLASEDHDFEEINYVNYIQSDGEVGKIKFNWKDKGRSIYSLPITEEITSAIDTYLTKLPSSEYKESISRLLYDFPDENYSSWIAKFWSNLFGKYGLLIIEPQLLRPLAGEIFTQILRHIPELNNILEDTNNKLLKSGYSPAISSNNLNLFTYDENLHRIKIQNPKNYIKTAENNPEQFSPDVLLRPVVADYILPNAVSAVGSSELFYQAQLKNIYEYFSISQPLLIPRQSYTFTFKKELDIMQKYKINPEDIFTKNLEDFFERLSPKEERKLFSEAKEKISMEIEKLSNHLHKIDPNLVKTNEQTLNLTLNTLKKLEDKTIKAIMSKKGYSRKHLRDLKNSLLPFGKLQERIFPLPCFLNYYGIDEFIETLLNNSNFMNFSHYFIMKTE